MKHLHISNYELTTFYSMRRRNNIVLFLLMTAMMFSIRANAQQTISLAKAIQNGLANKKNIGAGKLDVSISNLQTQALYRKFWPQVSVEYTYFYNPMLQTSILPIGVFNPTYPADATKSVQFGTKWTQSAGLTVIQPLLDVSVHRQINEAKLRERIATLSQQQSTYELAYTIAQTYIDIYLKEAKIKSVVADTSRTYNSYMLLKRKFDEKRLLKSDLNKAKINHNNTVQLLSDEIALLIQDKVYLLFLMGTKEIEKWDVEIDTNFISNYSISTAVHPINIDQLPDLQQLKLQSELTELQTTSEKAKHLPTINFKGYLGANQYTNTFNPVAAGSWFGLSYLGFDVKIPLLFGEDSHNKMQQLALQSNQYNLQKEDKTLQYSKDVLTATLKMDHVKTQLKTQEENILLGSESIEIFLARVQEGQESAYNLNIEEANLQVLKADYEANKKQWWVYWLDYIKASGQLAILWQ